MGIVKKTGGFFVWSLGVKSTKENVSGSARRIKEALSIAKNMISSLKPSKQGSEAHTGQFLKIKKMELSEIEQWRKIAASELGGWALVMSMLFIYIYNYSLNFAVILVIIAVTSRSTLIASQLMQINAYLSTKNK